MESFYDLLIIGGGINGAGIARDAAGRGMSVLLVEAQDLAGATSSNSTKLIHGGLRYLEYFEFRLVREALKEREVLLGLAPHIIQPLDFCLPHAHTIRPSWMIRAGLALYDRLGKREKLPASEAINLSTHPYGQRLQMQYKKGFRYADCRVDDARLVVLNALDAAELGAHILTRTACTGLRVEQGCWQAELRSTETGETVTQSASMVVNAAGPWVHSVLFGNSLARDGVTPAIRLVKGSHIIVPRLFDGKQAYMLQQPDKRIVFAIPYEHKFTLIGTTDVEYNGDPGKPHIDDAEKVYLCEAVSRYFNTKVTPESIAHAYSGVRALLDDGHEKARAVTRDYHLEFDESFGAPLLSVFGGKLTTYRRLAEEAVGRLVPHWPRANENPASLAGWTDTVPLPGGDILYGDFDGFVKDQQEKYDWMPSAMIERYARAYGTRMDRFLDGATGMDSLGCHLGDDVYQAEIDYLREREWAVTAEDVLWRRSKLGLHISKATQSNIELFMAGGRDEH